MTDRSVRVRLEADISDFVSDIGVKAVAAVKRLEGAATKAGGTLKKTATDGAGIGDGVKAGTTKATSDVKKFAADTDKAMTETGEKVKKTFEKSGGGSGKSFGSGFKKWLSGEGTSVFKEIGKQGGQVFGSGFLGMLKTPVLGPALIAALTAAVAVAAPAAGAVASSGFVAAFGIGLAALGIVFAAKSAEVKAVWSKTLADMGARMQVLSKPFEETLLAMAVVAKRTFDRFAPLLGAAFKQMAPALTAFGDQLGRAFEELAPAIEPLTNAFTAVVRSLGPATQSAIRNISEGLQDLAESVERSPDGLADLVRGTGELVRAGLDLIRVMNDVNAAFERITGGTSLVDVVMGGITASVRGTTIALQAITGPISLLDKGLQGLGLRGKSASDSTDTYSSALDGAVREMHKAKTPVDDLAEKFERQWRATQKANEELFRNSGLLLTLSGAQIGYEEALDRANETIKQNGKNTDISTEKGRENRRALDETAAAANAQATSSRNAGKASVASATSAQKAYEKQAIQMGYTKAEAHRMALEFIKIPPKVQADFKGDITDLDTKLADARRQLKDPNLTKTRRAQLEARIAQLLAAKATAQAAIDALHGKTVDLTINTYRNMIETTIDRGLVASGKGVPKADGGFHPRGFPSYADGKLPSQAMVAAGKGAGLVQWAEQETEGEAFIPLAPSKRQRSTQILGQVADEFGLGLVKSAANGGMHYQSPLVRDVAPANRYVGSFAGTFSGGSSTSREVHVHQNNTFNGIDPTSADLIAQRANAKMELMNRSY